uniref:Uncharacterized protein n=1 Tax=Acrobeloides nanus TaxID=290746 RepID=A0A914D825_9BILA
MNTFSIALFVFLLVVIEQQTNARYAKGSKSASASSIFLKYLKRQKYDLAKTINALEDVEGSQYEIKKSIEKGKHSAGFCCDILGANTTENHLPKTSDDDYAD